MKKFATGIFMWAASERQSRRYGFFYPAKKNYNEDVVCLVTCDKWLINKNLGKRVKITCEVIETRRSGHAGDRFLVPELYPETPVVGERIEFIGALEITTGEAACGSELGYAIGLRPLRGGIFWNDPRKYYRLHDQTVDFYIEVTDEPDFPLTDVVDSDFQGAISNGDGTLQARPLGANPRVKPEFERIEDGLFIVHRPTAHGNAGERFEVV